MVHISDRVLHDDYAERVVLPGVLGEFEVADLHVPIVSLLAKGSLSVYTKERSVSFNIHQGLMRFDGTELTAVVE